MKSKTNDLLMGLGACVLLLINIQSASAIDLSNLKPRQRDEYNAVVDRINSPFCPGRLLRDCPSSGADKLKKEVADLAAMNQTANDIKSQLFKKYGEDINPMPTGGVGFLAWLLPAGLFLVVLIIIIAKGTKKGDQ